MKETRREKHKKKGEKREEGDWNRGGKKTRELKQKEEPERGGAVGGT